MSVVDFQPDFGGIETWPPIDRYTFIVVEVMIVGQLLFLSMWLMLPWWREWIGRALMVKSLSWGLYLTSVLVTTMIVLRLGPQHWVEVLNISLLSLVALGIWSQDLALGWEIHRGNVDRTGRTGRRLSIYGLATLVPGVLAYLFTDWDVISLTAAALGSSMIAAHWLITGSLRGPTVPR